MRARRSSIPLPMRRRGRPALPWVGRPHLNPRSRSRRRVAVFGCGARAFCGLRCDGVTRGPAGASAGRRGGPKRLERAGQALRPSFKSWSGVREPCAAGAPGRAPQSSDELRSPWGLRTGRHGSVHVRPCKKRVLLRVREASLPISRSRPTGSLRTCGSSYLPALCAKTRRETAIKRHENLPKRRTLGPGRPSQTPDGKLRRARSKPGSPAA